MDEVSTTPTPDTPELLAQFEAGVTEGKDAVLLTLVELGHEDLAAEVRELVDEALRRTLGGWEIPDVVANLEAACGIEGRTLDQVLFSARADDATRERLSPGGDPTVEDCMRVSDWLGVDDVADFMRAVFRVAPPALG